MELRQELIRTLTPALCPDTRTYRSFWSRLKGKTLIRDENPHSHFCVYFLPYHEKSNQALIILHKKSGLWLCPGGHIEEHECPVDTLRREAKEELRMRLPAGAGMPFLCTVTDIENPARACRRHYDIWYVIAVREKRIPPPNGEFNKSRWIDISRVGRLVSDINNRTAFVKLAVMRDRNMLFGPGTENFMYA